MPARLKRTVGSFLTMLAFFWVYRVVAEPLIEPPRTEKRVAAPSAEDRELARRRQLENRLKNYLRFFPDGSWEREQPIVLESDSAKLLMKEYASLPDGRVRVTPCTVILLPDGEAEADGNRRRVIILQAPQGALLQFDEPVDLTRGVVSRFLGGTLQGPITIHSGPTRPDGSDDLYVTTHDVEMKDNLVSTPNEVQFRFGPSHGRGRDMQIELLPGPERSGKQRGPNVGGIQTFKLLRDVEMHLEPDSGGRDAANPISSSRAPIDIRCQGHFEFDLVEYVARFHDQVDVLRANPSGPGDQLNCELLSIFFGPRADKSGADKSPAPRRRGMMPQLEPRRIEAQGRPVVLRAASVGGEARGERLQWDISEGRILLDATEAKVRLQSPQLTADVSRFEAWLSQPAPTDRPELDPAGSSNEARQRAAVAGGSQIAAAPPGAQGAPRGHYQVTGGLLQVALVTRGPRTAVEHIHVKDDVLFVQTAAAQGAPNPLEIRGDELQALRVNRPDAQALIAGRPARVAIPGLTMVGQTARLSREQNRMEIDGAGQMQIDDSRAAGADAGRSNLWSGSGMVTVDWQGSMQFDGRTASFRREVVGRRGTQLLRTEQLDVNLNQRIDFGGRPTRQQPQVEVVTCRGPSLLENREFNGSQLAAVDRLLVRDLSVNQLTGEIGAPGPGRALSWRMGQPAQLTANQSGGPNRTQPVRQPNAAPTAGDDVVNYIGVQFQGPLTGNTIRREVTFHDQVRCVYGPAPGWDVELNADDPDKLAPRSIVMNTDALKVYEMGQPVGGRAPLEILAEGNTEIEGRRDEGDIFTAWAHQLSYAQAKDLLVLRGDGRAPAQLFRQARPGAAQAKTAARTILYWRSTNRVQYNDAQYLDFSSFAPQRAAPLPGPRQPAAAGTIPAQPAVTRP